MKISVSNLQQGSATWYKVIDIYITTTCIRVFTTCHVHPVQHGKAALHLAAEKGHETAADLLLQYKAFVNARSKTGISPLHLAAENGHKNLVKLFVEKYSATVDALSLVGRMLNCHCVIFLSAML